MGLLHACTSSRFDRYCQTILQKVKLIYISMPSETLSTIFSVFLDRLKRLSLSALIYIEIEHLLRCVCLSNSWVNCLLIKSNSFVFFHLSINNFFMFFTHWYKTNILFKVFNFLRLYLLSLLYSPKIFISKCIPPLNKFLV